MRERVRKMISEGASERARVGGAILAWVTMTRDETRDLASRRFSSTRRQAIAISTMRHLLFILLPSATALRLVVTGAAGYLGAEVACMAASVQTRSGHSSVKTGHATEHLEGCRVLAVDDLSDPATAREVVPPGEVDAVIHAASVFRPKWSGDMEASSSPNIELAEQMVCACAAANARARFDLEHGRGARHRPAADAVFGRWQARVSVGVHHSRLEHGQQTRRPGL